MNACIFKVQTVFGSHTHATIAKGKNNMNKFIHATQLFKNKNKNRRFFVSYAAYSHHRTVSVTSSKRHFSAAGSGRATQKDGVETPLVTNLSPFFAKRIEKFKQTGIRSNTLCKALSEVGIVTPSSIQELAIPPILDGKDTIFTAETGSGKTLTYLLPIIDDLMHENRLLGSSDTRSQYPRVVIITPTPELCKQIRQMARTLIDALKTGEPTLQEIHCHMAVSTEVFPAPQVKTTDILVMNPSCLETNLSNELIDNARVFVFDETDAMLGQSLKHAGRVLLEKICERKHRNVRISKKWLKKFDVEQDSASREKSYNSYEISESDQQDYARLYKHGQFVFAAATLPDTSAMGPCSYLRFLFRKAAWCRSDQVHQMKLNIPQRFIEVENEISYWKSLAEAEDEDNNDLDLNFDIPSPAPPPASETAVDTTLPSPRELIFDVLTVNPYHGAAAKNTNTSSSDLFIGEAPQSTKQAIEEQTIVFVNSRVTADGLWGHLRQNADRTGRNKHQILLLHRFLSSREREHVLHEFMYGTNKGERGAGQILVCTDVGARGIDFKNVDHVVQYEQADNLTVHLHRIGRAGRLTGGNHMLFDPIVTEQAEQEDGAATRVEKERREREGEEGVEKERKERRRRGEEEMGEGETLSVGSPLAQARGTSMHSSVHIHLMETIKKVIREGGDCAKLDYAFSRRGSLRNRFQNIKQRHKKQKQRRQNKQEEKENNGVHDYE